MEFSFGVDGSFPAGKEGLLSAVFYGRGSPACAEKGVDKILAGEFIDFSELLPNNIELMRQDGERDW